MLSGQNLTVFLGPSIRTVKADGLPTPDLTDQARWGITTAMDIKQDVIAAIGNTPLIKLRKASELTGCTILGKAEFMNPGQSVKDRAALFIIRDADRARRAEARRHHRRGHGRQYRHRPHGGRPTPWASAR